MLRAYPQGSEETRSAIIYIRSIESDSQLAIDEVLQTFEITSRELVWCVEYLGPAPWVLTRLDDNGNEFEIQRFLLEQSAQWIKLQYEKKGHKQAYFVRKISVSKQIRHELC